MGIVVQSEVGENAVILESKISAEDIYQRQQGNKILIYYKLIKSTYFLSILSKSVRIEGQHFSLKKDRALLKKLLK